MNVKLDVGNSRDFTFLLGAMAGVGSPQGSNGAPKAYEWVLGPEALQALLDLIPNPPLTDRDTWIAVLHGVKGAGGTFEIWNSWSSRWEHYDAMDTVRAWDGTVEENVRAGGGRLREMAETADPQGFEKWRQDWEAPEVFDDGAVHPTGPVDMGNTASPLQLLVAEEVIKQHGERMRFNHDSGCWHQFDGAVWEAMPASIKLGFVRATAWVQRNRGRFSKGEVKETNRATFSDGVEKYLRQHLTVRQASFDRDAWLLGTPGGTVDLRTGVLRQADPREFISKATAVAPDLTGACPRWLRFVKEITKGDRGAAIFLQQWAGYNLTGDTSEQMFLFLYGPGGNGKSVLMDTLGRLAGGYFCKPVADLYFAKQGTRHMQEVAMLAGARTVTVSEVPPNAAWDEGKLKDHTGGGAITANFMRQNSFSFVPQFKLTALGNHQPTFPGGMNAAIRRRFRLMLLDYQPKVPERALEAALWKEAPGILRWALDGLCDATNGWHVTGLNVPSVVQDATDEYVHDQDVLALWLDERVEKKLGAKTKTMDLFEDWGDWKHRNGALDLYNTTTSFGVEMAKRGHKRLHLKTGNVFEAIQLKSKAKSAF